MNKQPMPVAILAGGLATRLRPLTEKIPKALIEIRGEPFISHQLRLLAHGGIQKVVLCVGYRGEMIQAAVGDGSPWGVEVEYSIDGPELLGTAGAIKKALSLLGSSFLVLYGDSYLRCDYAAVQKTFQDNGKLGLMTVFRNRNQWDASNVELAGNQIVAYDKKQRSPQMHHIDYGLGAFSADAFADVPGSVKSDLEQVYRGLLRQGELQAFEVYERFYEVGSAAGIAEFEDFLDRTGGDA